MQSLFRRGAPEIAVDDLAGLLNDDDVRLVDVREIDEFRRGRVPGAVNMPLSRFAQTSASLPKDKRILVICESGSRSLAAADYLLKTGFPSAVSVRGGTSAWIRASKPIERD